MAKNHFTDFTDFITALFGHPAPATADLRRRTSATAGVLNFFFIIQLFILIMA